VAVNLKVDSRFQIFFSAAWYAMAATGLTVVAASLLLWWCVVVRGAAMVVGNGGANGGRWWWLPWLRMMVARTGAVSAGASPTMV